jgi:hypothetical protein
MYKVSYEFNVNGTDTNQNYIYLTTLSVDPQVIFTCDS